MQELIKQLCKIYPILKFSVGETFKWSPDEQTVFYVDEGTATCKWSLLHEVSHALLQHKRYKSDIELLQIEVAAWEKAVAIAPNFSVTQSLLSDYAQECIDTYRDWLHKRSSCPYCNLQGLQTNASQYSCINCDALWSVSTAQPCRPYRRLEPALDG